MLSLQKGVNELRVLLKIRYRKPYSIYDAVIQLFTSIDKIAAIPLTDNATSVIYD